MTSSVKKFEKEKTANFTRTAVDEGYVMLQSNNDFMTVLSNGTIILNNSPLKTYETNINDKIFLTFGRGNELTIDNIKFSRVDELILYLFQDKQVSANEFILHLNGNTLDNSADNLKLATSEDLIQGNWEIDETDVEKDLKLLFASDKLKKKYEELKSALAINPYRLPEKFVPSKHGAKLQNTTFDGLDVYHASLSKNQRVFYVIRKNSIIVVKIKLQGIVQIIQAYGHDYRRG